MKKTGMMSPWTYLTIENETYKIELNIVKKAISHGVIDGLPRKLHRTHSGNYLLAKDFYDKFFTPRGIE